MLYITEQQDVFTDEILIEKLGVVRVSQYLFYVKRGQLVCENVRVKGKGGGVAYMLC